MNVKREKWGRRYVYVVRVKGKLQTWKNVRGSKQKLPTLRRIYKLNKTFNPQIKLTKEKLTNVTLISKTKTSSIDERNKPAITTKPSKKAMYSVEGYINGERIVANSMTDSDIPAKRKKRDAWESFLERVSQVSGGDYDADEGLKYINQVKNIREGWVYYVKV